MKTLYIHIGMHKTGTTAIQNFLFLNKEKLAREGLLYYSDVPIDYKFANALKNKEDFNYIKEHIRGLNDVRQSKVILSCEVFLEGDHIPELLMEILNNESIYNKFKIKIIVYVRRWYEWIESAYLQVSKGVSRQGLSFNEYLEQTALDKFLNRIFLWKEIFGIENIIFRIYDKDQFKNQSVIDDFLSVFNIELLDDYITPPSEKLNIGIDVIEAYILNTSKDIFKNQQQLNYFLSVIKESKTQNYSKCLMDNEQLFNIRKKYDSIYNSLARVFLEKSNDKIIPDKIDRSKINLLSRDEISENSIRLLVKCMNDLLEKMERNG